MGQAIEQLLAVAGPATAGTRQPSGAPGHLGQELESLLDVRNGFVAFESALRVFPGGPTTSQHHLGAWNAPRLWRDAYDDLADGVFCFAEDILGVQFAIAGDAIVTFDPETGEREWLASSLEGWAAALLDDVNVLTGFPLAHAWQQLHGALPAAQRLVPIVPFVLGGEFAVPNLHALDAVIGMRLRGEIAVQLRDLPDGASVTYGTDA